MAAKPKLIDFKGKWRLSRAIEDKLTGLQGTLEGEATFRPRSDGALDYEETGALSYGDQAPVLASRRYIWATDGQGIAVSFEDGRPFHRIELDRLMPEANHHCEPDLYNVSYDLTKWRGKKTEWRSIWRVVGPKKNYRMLSHYRRADEGA